MLKLGSFCALHANVKHHASCKSDGKLVRSTSGVQMLAANKWYGAWGSAVLRLGIVSMFGMYPLVQQESYHTNAPAPLSAHLVHF